MKGIGSKFRILCLGIWSLEEKAGKEPMQEKDSGAKDLPGIKVPSWTCRRRSRAGERRFRSSKEPLARRSAQGPARGRRVCSFIGVGYLGLFGLWLMEGPWSVQGCFLRCVGKEEAAEQKKQEEKELLILFSREEGRRRRVQRPRNAAIWLWLCSSTKLQSS